MNDDVLVVAVDPDAKYIAVALLDNTVKVTYFLVTFKLLLFNNFFHTKSMSVS